LLSQSTLAGSVVPLVLVTVGDLLVYGISYPLLSKYESGEFKDATSGLFRIVGVLVSQMHHFPGEVGK
jgi:hypothetical protein